MELYLIRKTVFGQDLLYPNCDQSKALANFAGVKTFNTAKELQLENMAYDLLIDDQTAKRH